MCCLLNIMYSVFFRFKARPLRPTHLVKIFVKFSAVLKISSTEGPETTILASSA